MYLGRKGQFLWFSTSIIFIISAVLMIQSLWNMSGEIDYLREESIARAFEIEMSYMDMNLQGPVGADRPALLPYKIEQCLALVDRLGSGSTFTGRTAFFNRCVDDVEHWDDLRRCRNDLDDANSQCDQRIEAVHTMYEDCCEPEDVERKVEQ